MDNSIIANNPVLAPYLQQTQQSVEKGRIFYVEDFEEFRKSPHSNGNDYIAVTKDLKYVFIKRVDNDGNVSMASFDPKEVPNPVPVTQTEVSTSIQELEKRVDKRLTGIETALSLITQKLMEGKTDGSSGVFQQKQDGIAGSLVLKEPVFKQ